MAPQTLVVIPARGGSKGIPRKNLRLLNGKPLITYAINACKKAKSDLDIVVSSDDLEILSIANKLGVQTHHRSGHLANDSTPLDPVICDALKKAEEVNSKQYDHVVTIQPTSPLITSNTIDSAINRFGTINADTLISVKDDTHLRWGRDGSSFRPLYKERVNRQQLPQEFTETGSIVIARAELLKNTNTRINPYCLDLFEMPTNEAIDIDTFEDWSVCEFILRRKHIVFVVRGNKEVGSGHINRALLLADSIVDHKITFVCPSDSEMAYNEIASKNYCCQITDNVLFTIKDLSPDMVVNDMLDTSIEYVTALKDLDIKVVNFEDTGEGAHYADAVINAIYMSDQDVDRFYYGPRFFCLREEFALTESNDISMNCTKALLTFGGTDPSNRTRLVLESIAEFSDHVIIDVVLGLGYDEARSLDDITSKFPNIKIHRNIKNISDFIASADVIFSSCGRTLFEIASIGIPTICIPANKKEESHGFASAKNGFVVLNRNSKDLQGDVRSTFSNLINSSKAYRQSLKDKQVKIDFKQNKARVVKILKDLL